MPVCGLQGATSGAKLVYRIRSEVMFILLSSEIVSQAQETSSSCESCNICRGQEVAMLQYLRILMYIEGWIHDEN